MRGLHYQERKAILQLIYYLFTNTLNFCIWARDIDSTPRTLSLSVSSEMRSGQSSLPSELTEIKSSVLGIDLTPPFLRPTRLYQPPSAFLSVVKTLQRPLLLLRVYEPIILVVLSILQIFRLLSGGDIMIFSIPFFLSQSWLIVGLYST